MRTEAYIQNIKCLPFYEGQALFVYDYVSLYFDVRFGECLPENKKVD